MLVYTHTLTNKEGVKKSRAAEIKVLNAWADDLAPFDPPQVSVSVCLSVCLSLSLSLSLSLFLSHTHTHTPTHTCKHTNVILFFFFNKKEVKEGVYVFGRVWVLTPCLCHSAFGLPGLLAFQL